MLEKIRDAASGTGVTISLSRYPLVPAEILHAAQGRAVTLTFTRSGGDKIVLYGKDIPFLDKSVLYYTADELAQMAAEIARANTAASETEKDRGMPVYIPPEPSAVAVISETESGQAVVEYRYAGEDEAAVEEVAVESPPPQLPEDRDAYGQAAFLAETPHTVQGGKAGMSPKKLIAVLLAVTAVAMAALAIWTLTGGTTGGKKSGKEGKSNHESKAP